VGCKFFTGVYANLIRRFLTRKLQDGGRILCDRKRYQGDLSACGNVSGHGRYTSTGIESDYTDDSVRSKPELETLPKTGSTNKLATETDIDAISVAIQT